MSEIKFYELKCKRCGGQLEQNGAIYKCESCGKIFEKQVVTDVADQLRAVLNEQKQEAVANLRQQLWAEMHAQYINSEKITDLARDIKKYLPDDYFANFCEVANNGNDRQVSHFLNNTPQSAMADYADIVLDFMLKSVTASNLNAISLFIDRAFKGDTQNYDKYMTRYEEEAQKVSSGIYELILTRDVFLAYSSADIDKVIELCDFLERNKITCFLALRNLRHGRGAVDNYDQALKTAIDNCKTVVFVSSTYSRSLTCDALTKELPYIRQKDIDGAPAEFRRAYDKMPSDYMMPRVEYLIEDYSGDVAEMMTKEFFHGIEWCKSKEAVAARITDYLTETHETAAQRAERENREFQQQLEEERRKAEEVKARAKELELKIAEAEKARLEAERRATEVRNIAPVDSGDKEDPDAKYCKKCRTANRKNAKFCSSCGSGEFFASFGEYVASKIKFCALCGAQNNVEDKFCAECGSKEFVPTKKAYEDLKAQIAEEERQRKIREEQERLRREEEERQRKIREDFDIQNGVLIKYKGEGGEVMIPDGVTSIGESAFYCYDSLVSVIMPNNVISICDGAFFNCLSLENIILPNSLTSIGKSVFKNCSTLKKLIIPKSVIKIGAEAFDNCPYLNLIFEDKNFGDKYLEEERQRKIREIINESFDIQNGVLIKYKGEGGDVVIPDDVTSIGDNAFSNCLSLKSITISDRVTSIGDKAFEECNSLETIIIPDSVTSIGESAFSNCLSLKSITISDRVTSIGDKAFEECNSLETIIIPDRVTSIGNYAFCRCTSLKSVKMGRSVTYIGKSAFSNCHSLKSITISNRVTSIGDNAFYACNSLEDIIIPDRVTSIGNYAFCRCTSLKSVKMGRSVTYIGESAFSGCKRLTNIVWGNFSNKVEIDYFAFDQCTSLEKVEIPANVSFIGCKVFKYCSSLKSVTFSNLPEQCTVNDNYTTNWYIFFGCDKLKTIYCRKKKPFFDNTKYFYARLFGFFLEENRAEIVWNYKGN